ncbi:MAG: hypothetical protein ACRENI_11705 [Gemmatimonadaceae bacterium]
MKHPWAALSVVLALITLLPAAASGQQAGTQAPEERRDAAAELGQNYPNPFNPETKIPFALGEPTCQDGGRIYRVTLRIYNVLAQLVAVPILQGEGAPPSAAGAELRELALPCGQYTAYWDGRYLNTSREVASGIYLYQLEVDGVAVVTRKMIVAK